MILDLIFIAAVIIFALVGRKRGFVHTILQVLSTVLSIIIALAIKEPVTSFIEKTDLYKKNISQVAKIITPDINSGNAINNKPFGGIAGKMLSESETFNSAINSVSESIAGAIIGIIISVIIFILALMLARMLSRFIEKVFRLPGLNFFNRLTGMAWGVILVFLISYMILAVGSGTFLADSEFFSNQLNNSFIVKHLYENNLLFNFFIKST